MPVRGVPDGKEDKSGLKQTAGVVVDERFFAVLGRPFQLGPLCQDSLIDWRPIASLHFSPAGWLTLAESRQ